MQEIFEYFCFDQYDRQVYFSRNQFLEEFAVFLNISFIRVISIDASL